MADAAARAQAAKAPAVKPAKESMFVWEGTDKRGKKVKGEMSGTNDALVKALLRRQSVNPRGCGKSPSS